MGRIKESTTVTIEPKLKRWALINGVNFSEEMEIRLIELQRRKNGLAGLKARRVEIYNKVEEKRNDLLEIDKEIKTIQMERQKELKESKLTNEEFKFFKGFKKGSLGKIEVYAEGQRRAYENHFNKTLSKKVFELKIKKYLEKKT